jgi:two-component system chemotaxis response regulator CheB
MAIVQHPYEALVPSMPLAAIQNVEVDKIVRADEIARLLAEAVWRDALDQPAAVEPAGVEPTAAESAAAVADDRDISQATIAPDLLDKIEGPPSHFTCPECGGSLWEIQQGNGTRFRCHTGHGFTPQTLLFEQNARIENALWSAVRTFQERAALHRELGHKAEQRQMMSMAESCHAKAQEEQDKAAVLRQLLAPHPTESELPAPS